MPESARLALRFDVDRLQSVFQRLASGVWTPHFNASFFEGDWNKWVRRRKRPMSLSFPNFGMLGGADPLALVGLPVRMNLISFLKSGSRGTRAPRGSAPLPMAEISVLGKLSDIGRKRLRHMPVQLVAARTSRAPIFLRQRSIHCLVSFSWTPF
jgi:hypothetical protein